MLRSWDQDWLVETLEGVEVDDDAVELLLDEESLEEVLLLELPVSLDDELSSLEELVLPDDVSLDVDPESQEDSSLLEPS